MPSPGDFSGLSCLVLGGGGFIGTNLCRALVVRGADIGAFGRQAHFPQALEGVQWLMGDFADRAAVARAVEGREVVFHLAAGSIPDSSNRDPLGDLLSSVAPTLQLLDICRSSGVRRVVFVSSGGTVYGIPETVPIPETAVTEPISAYGVSKLAIEKYLRIYQRLHGMEYQVARLSNPFGPYQRHDRRQGLVAALLYRALHDIPVEIWGDGRVVRDFLYIDDAIEALLMLASYDGPHRVFNVGSGIGRSVLDVLTDIGKVIGDYSIPCNFRPGRVADVPVNVLDIGLIGREMGWTPRTEWQDALRRTAAWLRDNS